MLHSHLMTATISMKALNAAILPPISARSNRRTEHRKKYLPLSSFLPIATPKTSISARFSTNPPTLREGLKKGSLQIHGGLVFLSSLLNSQLARALTYEEALEQSVTSSDFESTYGGGLDDVISFVAENPAAIAAAVAITAVPLLLSQFLKKPKPWGLDSARSAYEKLGGDPNAQLLDIRAPAEFRLVGGPDMKGLGKKSVSITYKGEDKPAFLKKLALKFKEPENTTLFILDKFDGNSELVAELVTVNGFKAAYAIKDGAEGPRGWLNSGLPWIAPRKGLSLDLSNLTDALSGAIGDGSDGLSVALTVAAVTGLGLLAFAEIETILQLLGSAALIQVVSKKLLLAEARQATLKEVDEFLNTKIVPKDLVDDVKQIGKALLPPVVGKALPAPVEASTEYASANSTVQEAEAASESNPEPPQVDSAPVPEVQAVSSAGIQKPLSPYPYYPDLKPPTSPTPSQP